MSEGKEFQFIKNEEIDVVAILKLLWSKRKTIYKTVAVFFVLGFLIAVFSGKEYTATVTFIPQESGVEIGGGLGGLAAMAGINLDGMGAETGISPLLYPEIINSLSYQIEMLKTPMTFEGYENQITFSEYFLDSENGSYIGLIRKYTLDLPRTIVNALKSKEKSQYSKEGIIKGLTENEYKLTLILMKRLELDVDVDEGLIRLTGKMPEALASAELTDKAQRLLQKYIIDFKTQKSKNQLKFIEERFLEKKDEFLKVQEELAVFRDRNMNVYSAFAKTSEERLESEYELAYSIYSELANQYETQKIKVKEDTPVFTVIDAVSIPYLRSEPRRFLILLSYTLFGFVIAVSFVLGRVYYNKTKKKWNES